MAFGYCTEDEAANLKPKVALVDGDNRVTNQM
jgi:aspartate 1-decarboxylase